MQRTFLLCALVLTPAFAHFSSSSSSESCEDGHGNGHGGGGRPRPPSGGQNGGCESGWRRFNRPSGGWCIRVFGGRLSRPNAEAQCQSYGATLSGLQNYEEIQYITSQAVRVVTSQSTTSVWVGAQRKAACARQGLTATCNGQTSFGWTDGSATGTAGFIWDYKQPDNAHNLLQNCAVVLAARTPTVQVGSVTWKTNYMDDTDCDLISSSPTPRAVLAYVCGKVAR